MLFFPSPTRDLGFDWIMENQMEIDTDSRLHSGFRVKGFWGCLINFHMSHSPNS